MVTKQSIPEMPVEESEPESSRILRSSDLKLESSGGPLLASLSVVIPVYNSEQSLPVLLARLDSVLPDVARRFEVILVNDGSRDQSAKVLDEASKTYRWMRVIDLMRNFGQHNALLCGIRSATSEIIVTIDDDLQNPPEDIPKLLTKLAEGYDVIYGYPDRESHGFLRNLASLITKVGLQQVMGVATARRISSFRAFRAELRAAFQDYRGAFVSIDVLLTWGTSRFASIPVRNPPRKFGASNYTIRKLIAHAINIMTGYSTLPLRVASMAGFAFALFGFLVLAFVVAHYLISGANVPGFAFLTSVISIFAGTQLFALGIIGEYLGRMHFRLLDRPSYTVRPKKNVDDNAESARSAAAGSE